MYNLPTSTLCRSPSDRPHAQKRCHPPSPKRAIKKCAFDIDSLLKPTNNSSYVDDTEDASSDDGHAHFESSSSFCTSPLASYALFNQLKANDHSVLSSSFDSDHFGAPTKGKRVRTIFTGEQLGRLEAEFEKQQYIVGHERSHLAEQLDLSVAQVKIWFQNRRIKWRRQALDNAPS